MDKDKLFLLDAYALIYRAYYALMRMPRVTSDGRNTSAVFGFCTTLDDILRRENPEYMAVCFDPTGGHTFRHEMYPQYKAGRDKQPEDITTAIPYIKDIIRARGIRVIEVERYEADDVIGTLAREASATQLTTYMMTMDKDYGQLVRDNVLMYRPALKGRDFEIRGVQQICERYGISSPAQVIDLLALEGDTSDNVPGCPGVGEKTAAKLIAQWGSVDNLLAHAQSIPGALGRKIVDNAEQIRFSRKLVTIDTHVPLDVSVSDLRRTEPDYAALRRIYADLEFKSLLSRLPGGEEPAPQKTQGIKPAEPTAGASLFDFADDMPAVQTPAEIDIEVNIAGDADSVTRFLADAGGDGCTHAALCVLADGDEAMTAVLKGMALCCGTPDTAADARTIYIPAALVKMCSGALTAFLASPGTTVASHALKRDMLLLRRWDVTLPADTSAAYDTSVAHYVINPDTSHHIADVAFQMLGRTLSTYTLSAADRRRIHAEQTECAHVACEYAAATLSLINPLSEAMTGENLSHLFRETEMPLVGVLARMEAAGMRIDSAELARMSADITAQIAGIEHQAHMLAGAEFNLGSPSQVGEILFSRLAIDPKAKRTKTGAFSTTEEILEKHRHTHPVVDLILKYRALKKLLSTYIDALPRLVNPATGHIHTTFNQTVTATGRLSSTNPNLQNIPVRSDLGREIRRAFIADEGCLLLSADYSQIELRLMAHLSGDKAMIDAFRAGEDIHRSTAAKIYHLPLDEVTDAQRRAAKTANFGIIYGISTFGLSERLGIPRAEAKALIQGYMSTYPGVSAYMERVIDAARRDLYVETAMHRRRYLPEINSRNAVVRGYAERNAVNAPIQGTAADIIKVAMVRIDSAMRNAGMKSRMIMQVHDELIFNVVPEELETLKSMVIDLMQTAFTATVPLTVSASAASNWLEAH